MPIMSRAVAEFIGTFWLVLGGCGSAVLAASSSYSGGTGIGPLGISLAFGLTVLTMAYAIGPISGCHLNPAVSVGLAIGGRFKKSDVPYYVVAQVLGAILAAAILYWIASGRSGFNVKSGFAVNGYGALSPRGYSMMAAFLTETVMTFMFLLIILGSTHERASKDFSPLAIGGAYALIYLISIPITNGSANPARSTGPALFAGAKAVSHLWLFWAAPLLGSALAGVLYRWNQTRGQDQTA